MKKILLAVDGSEHALSAARNLIRAASWLREPPEVVLLLVHLPVPQVHGLSRVVGKQALNRYYREEAEAALAGCKELLQRSGLRFTTEIEVGQIAESIVAKAAERGCDVIYMGTRGLNAMSNMMLGSVATKVLHLSNIPVVLSR